MVLDAQLRGSREKAFSVVVPQVWNSTWEWFAWPRLFLKSFSKPNFLGRLLVLFVNMLVFIIYILKKFYFVCCFLFDYKPPMSRKGGI